jgi:hypothetical protein
MSLKPQNIVQAAEADLKRRERNIKRHRGELSSDIEHYAFHASHVRRADDVAHLLLIALAHGMPKTKKKNTIMIYGDPDLLRSALVACHG